MPELPEVETTRRGIAPHITGQQVSKVIVRNPRLRWRVPATLAKQLPGHTISSVERRAKYLLLKTGTGTVIIHLGMSGSLRITDATAPPADYEHVEFVFANGKSLRLRDPRRFGAVLWTRTDALKHKLLQKTGPEPLGKDMDAGYLFDRSRTRRCSVKEFIMNSQVVAGVGNIYACEALFVAGIHPRRAAGNISLSRYQRLAKAIKQVLKAAIKQGGTSLRDFTASDGKPGYFKQQLKVYGREANSCDECGSMIKRITQGQRSSFYCPRCQR